MNSPSKQAYKMLTGEDDGRLCKDIPEELCKEQAGNFMKHLVSLSFTKTGDGLFDPKLVLSWLLQSLGASSVFIGFLVPIRESGSLLPQLFIAEFVRSRKKRKWVWALGSLLQGLSVIGVAIVAMSAEGDRAGYSILALLCLFAVSRSFCSVSYKDVLGKTVSKSTRGTATGSATSLAAFLILLFALFLSLNILELSTQLISEVLLLAGSFWFLASLTFASLKETEGATEGGENASRSIIARLSVLKSDPQLLRFVTVRGLLISTALAPPYLLLLAGVEGSAKSIFDLGPILLASSLAALLSSYAWGRLADSSSRKVLFFASLMAGCTLAISALIAIRRPQLLSIPVVLPIILFFLLIAYQGVRLGRSTHLVDMTSADKRANYTAVSNTTIGVLLVLGGSFGLFASKFGVPAVLIVFSGMCFLAAYGASGLKQVQ